MSAAVEWSIRLSEQLSGLQGQFTADGGDELDFTSRSLARLEEFLSANFADPAELREDEDGEELAEGAAAYVGEVLLRLAGGGWDEEDAPGPLLVPTIHADPVLGLPPARPLDLVFAAVGGDGALRQQYGQWAEAVQRYAAAHPGWTPDKEWTPGVDPLPVSADEREHLANWLATQERAFRGWVRRHGAGVDWDFSRASVAALDALVLAADPADGAFRDGAGWYAGEAMRRVGGGAWQFRHGDPLQSMYVGQPYLAVPDGVQGHPFMAMRLIQRDQRPGRLLKQYDLYVA